MPLNLTPTRKDKPILGFLKDSPAALQSVRRTTRDRQPKDQQAPVFRTTRSHTTETTAR